MMNMLNEPLHDMTCVVKLAPSSIGGGDLVKFNIGTSLFFLGTNNLLWRGLFSYVFKM